MNQHLKISRKIRPGGIRQDLESRFICEALRCFVKSDHSPLLGAEHLHWSRVEELILHYNLSPIFHSIFEKSNAPAERLENWYRLRLGFLMRNLRILDDAVVLFSIMEGNGIQAVGLRGLNLAHFHYPDPGLRPMRDVDILIRPADRDKLKCCLKIQGYVPIQTLRSQLVYDINGTVYEIHWSLLTAKRYRKALNSDMLIELRHRKETNNGHIYCLPKEYELINIIIHAFIHHDLNTLLPLVDIGILLNTGDMDWPLIIDWCRKSGLTRLVQFTLTFANKMLRLDLEPVLKEFPSLPYETNGIFDAYATVIWGRDTPEHRLLRYKNLFYVAEHNRTKFRQFLCLFNPDEWIDFLHLLFKGQLVRKGGYENNKTEPEKERNEV